MSAAGRLALAAVIAAAALPAAARAQGAARVQVVDAGPGPSGRLVRDALAQPHVLRYADSARVALPRDSVFPVTVIVLGGDATVASTVRGDVIVVDGDLFVQPGAEISGRAVAVGGCVYTSALATVRGGQLCFRENTLVMERTPDGETRLSYRHLRVGPPSGVYLPGISGFQLPSYDRVDGLSLTWGPTLALDTGRVELDARATYRSDLGAVDPRVIARWQLGRRTAVVVDAARGTFTNDAWIRGDIINSIGAFVSGTDARNYFRADRAEGRFSRAYETARGATELWVGARGERARSVAPDVGARSAPFSIFGRRDSVEGMLRPNPQGTEGRIASALLGAERTFTEGDLSARATLVVELPFDASGGRRFVQSALDGETSFATFGTQRVQAGIHAVLTTGDSTPRQRYVYLGGSGTLPTERLLGSGGDRLLYVDGLYSVPFERIELPFVGSPVVGLRYAAGSAGVRELPRITQNVGVRLSLAMLRVDFMVNPATRDTNLGFGVAVLR